MQRREMLRLLSVTALTPVVPADLFAKLRQAQPSSNYSLRTLNPQQNETVVAMMDLIIPATDTPGAKEARVNEFLDVILTGWATPAEKSKFLSGLEEVDRQSERLFSKKFVEASVEQQSALLRTLDDSVDWAHAYQSDDDEEDTGYDYDSRLRGEFFRVFKMVTLHGYYTSEIGFTQELKKEIIPGAQHGCVPLPAGKRA